MGSQDYIEIANERPLLDKNNSPGQHDDDISLTIKEEHGLQHKPGDWKAPMVLLGFYYLQGTAYSGISANLVVYLKTVLHRNNTSNAANVATWTGTSYLTPLLWAFISDTYWGSYKTIFVSGVIFILGLVAITISAFTPIFGWHPCEGSSCQQANQAQSITFFSGLYLVAFGCGGVGSLLVPFGADQFDDENPIEGKKKGSFFIWIYFSGALAVLSSGTLIVWIEQYIDWSIGFGIAASCMAVGLGGFILGKPTFRIREASGNRFKSIFQVLTASFRNMKSEIPTDSSLLYQANHKNSQRILAHTEEFRFLDKAAIVSNSGTENIYPQSSWRLCTVTQVEELKVLVRLVPIWVTSTVFTAAFSQCSITFIQQGSAMNTRIASFSIPPAAMSSFVVISATIWVLVHQKIVVPSIQRFSRNGGEPSLLQRMGAGHFLLIITMAIAAFVEVRRLERIKNGGLISIAWQLPQYFTLAGSEVFLYISQLRFFYDQAPDTMKSICSAFSTLAGSAGQYLSSLLVVLVGLLTASPGRPGWIADDLNEGHLDYYFWSLVGLCTLNLAAYLAATRNYTPKKVISES